MDEKAVVELRGSVRGNVVLPGDEKYDEARRVYNAMINRKPAVVVKCTGVADVISAMRVARKAGIAVAIRGGGHSVPGFGTADDAMVLDLGGMKGIWVDPTSMTALAEGGVTWGEFNHATYSFGMATTGGVVSTTGIAGLTLGGGIGYLARSHGLALDNLLSADVVLADGLFLTANEKENQDLFWALRGGGGNFGVVTSFKFRLHPLKDIVGGPIFFEVDDAPKVLHAYDEYMTEAPRELGAFFGWHRAPPLPFIPANRHNDPFCVVVACWTGASDQARKALEPIRGAAHVVAEGVGPMPYPALNSAFDVLFPPGLQHYWKAVFTKELDEGAIKAHMEYGPKVPVVNSVMHIYPINGAVHDVPSDATSFGHRDAKYATVIAGMWPNPVQNDSNIRWVKDYYNALAPHSEKGGYINFAAEDDADRVRANFGRNYDRLREVKSKFDPDNVFRFNQNITTSGT